MVDSLNNPERESNAVMTESAEYHMLTQVRGL